MIVLLDIKQFDQINDPTLQRVISQRFNEPFDPDIDGYGIVIEPGDTPEDPRPRGFLVCLKNQAGRYFGICRQTFRNPS